MAKNRLLSPEEVAQDVLDIFNRNTSGIDVAGKKAVWEALAGWLGGFPVDGGESDPQSR